MLRHDFFFVHFLHGEKRCYFWCFKYFITILFPLTLTGVRRFRRYCRHNAQFSFIIIFIKLFVVFLNEIHDSTDNCRFTRRLVTRWRYVPNVAVCFAFLLLIHTTTVNSDELVMTIVLDVLGDHGGDILDQVSQWFPGIPGVLLGRVVVLPCFSYLCMFCTDGASSTYWRRMSSIQPQTAFTHMSDGSRNRSFHYVFKFPPHSLQRIYHRLHKFLLFIIMNWRMSVVNVHNNVWKQLRSETHTYST